MYSVAKIHYTTITMNKEGVARFVYKQENFFKKKFITLHRFEKKVDRISRTAIMI